MLTRYAIFCDDRCSTETLATFAASRSKGGENFMRINFGLGPNVLICGAAGAALGLILALWGAGANTGIVVATTIVMAVLSGIFGMFV